jgi:hypothetical protein
MFSLIAKHQLVVKPDFYLSIQFCLISLETIFLVYKLTQQQNITLNEQSMSVIMSIRLF